MEMNKEKSRKKIAMVCHWESPYKEEWKGGMGVYMDSLARKLSHEGLEIDFYVPRVAEYPREQEVTPGVKIIRLNTPIQSVDGDIRNEAHMTKFGEELVTYTNNNNLKYDLVHAQYWSSLASSRMLAQDQSIPLVVQLHQLQLLKEIAFDRLGLPIEKQPGRIESEKEAIRHADRVVLVSNEQLYDLEKEYYEGELPFSVRRKTAIIRNAIETEKYSYVTAEKRAALKNARNIDPESFVVSFHGRIDPDKCVDKLVYATHLLQNALPDKKIDLSIIGRGSELTRLENLVSDLKMKDVHFYGYQTGEDLRDLVKMSDVGVIPSSYESFGLSVAELMSLGIPAVVWEHSGGPEEVTGKVNPIIPPVTSIVDLKDTLEEMVLNPRLREKKGLQMRERCVNKFGWPRLISEMKQLYSELGV